MKSKLHVSQSDIASQVESDLADTIGMKQHYLVQLVWQIKLEGSLQSQLASCVDENLKQLEKVTVTSLSLLVRNEIRYGGDC